MPAYIATQGPLSHTISDFWQVGREVGALAVLTQNLLHCFTVLIFWQMVWENGCTVIVMMTALVEDGEKQCDRYWPDEGSSLYHIYEVKAPPGSRPPSLCCEGEPTFDLLTFSVTIHACRSTWCQSTSGAMTSWCAAST